MASRLQSVVSNLGYLVLWILQVVLASFTIFQLHGTLISIAIAVIEEPTLRPTGWTINTTHGLSRVFWLILGIIWLGWVMFTEGYMREGKDQRRLLQRFFLLLLILTVIYALSYGVLLFLY